MLKILGVLILLLSANQGIAVTTKIPDFQFQSIDGGLLSLKEFSGKTVLVTNTASKCGFTGQYTGLQKLHDKYKSKGFVVLGIPSTNFRQEFSKNEEVKEFCEVNFSINFPMTEITDVVGKNAHPFYQWLSENYNYSPKWNFSKILIGPDGTVKATFGTTVRPTSAKIQNTILEIIEK
jgi:glutathione peroxidase